MSTSPWVDAVMKARTALDPKRAAVEASIRACPNCRPEPISPRESRAQLGDSFLAAIRDGSVLLGPADLATVRSMAADAIAYREEVARKAGRRSPPRGKRDLDLAASYTALLGELGGAE